MNFEQFQQHVFQISEIAKKFGISKIFVIGSVAKGDQTAHSDVDFLIEMQGFVVVSGWGKL